MNLYNTIHLHKDYPNIIFEEFHEFSFDNIRFKNTLVIRSDFVKNTFNFVPVNINKGIIIKADEFINEGIISQDGKGYYGDFFDIELKNNIVLNGRGGIGGKSVKCQKNQYLSGIDGIDGHYSTAGGGSGSIGTFNCFGSISEGTQGSTFGGGLGGAGIYTNSHLVRRHYNTPAKNKAYSFSEKFISGNGAGYNNINMGGGLIIIFANKVRNYGIISACGRPGGIGNFPGGSSGGGAIFIFTNDFKGNLPIAYGGDRVSGLVSGGKGGNGTVLITNLN